MADMENIHKEITIPNRIFLKGFDVSTEEEDLQNIFAKYGSIVETNIIRDQRTKQSKGYGFITFDSQQVAEKVVETIKSVEVNGTEVVVGKAKIRRRPPTAKYFHPDFANQPPTTLVSVSPDGLFTFHQPNIPYIPQFVPISAPYSFDASVPMKFDNYAVNQMPLPPVTSQQITTNGYQFPFVDTTGQFSPPTDKGRKEPEEMQPAMSVSSNPLRKILFGIVFSL